MRPNLLPRALVAAGLAAALLPCAAPAAQQQRQDSDPPVAFRADVRLVLHGIAVLDGQGQPVTDLAPGELRVYEDGQVRELQLFLAPNDTPLDIVLALDTSSSLAPWAATVRRAARTFLLSLDVRDCVYLQPFNSEVGPGTWGSPYDPALGRRIDNLFLDGTTALYDAVVAGIEALAADPGSRGCGGNGTASLDGTGAMIDTAAQAGAPRRRRAIVVVSDGEDRSSQRRFDEALDLARDASVPVFPVVVGEASRDERLRAVLDALAGNTGGTVIPTTGADELKRAYEDVESLLRASYLVGYAPPEAEDPGTWHTVEVRSRRPSYRLVHRDRYFR